MTERWSPLLENPPELAQPLLAAIRSTLPTVFDLSLKAPEQPTKAVAVGIRIDGDDRARLTVSGHDLWRGKHGPRDALFMNFTGEALVRERRLRVAGDVVLDLQTNALLRLRLSEPLIA